MNKIEILNEIDNKCEELENEKKILSVKGEYLAKKMSESKELQNIDILYSSNYVRSISTAKYIASKNNISLNINENFGERRYGVNKYEELPIDFEVMQFNDENYKLENGENQKEVRERMYNALMSILNQNKRKRIVVVSHATAIAYLLKKWCLIEYNNEYKFNNKIFFDGIWKCGEIFKLEFDGKNKLIDIKNIKITE